MSQFRWTAAEVLRALGHAPHAADEQERYARVATDSRSVGAGDLFVALKGERFDAHDFLAQIAAAGAAAAVVQRVPDGAPRGLRYFVVRDPRAALGLLGRHRRRALAVPAVAVVGSNGKTTTKDLLRAALGAQLRVHATEGNFNNQVGLPLTLLAAPDDAEVLVLELGTNEPGEIEILARICEPTHAVVTTVAEEHLEKLGSLEGVLAEETAILPHLPEEGLAFVGEEPAILPERARELLGIGRVLVAGLTPAAELHPERGEVETLPDATTRWRWRGETLHLPLRGLYNVRNALLALGVARELGVETGDAMRAIERMPPPRLRGEWRQIGRLRVIADCYNANPGSLAAAVELLASLPAAGRKIAVVGTMRELGEQEAALHRRAAAEIAERVGDGIDLVVATGLFVPAFAPLAQRLGERLLLSDDPLQAYERLAPALRGDETILLKASRAVALERWIERLEELF